MNQSQIKIVNHIIAKWRRALTSAKSESEKNKINDIIKELEEALENDRKERNKDRELS